MTRTEIAPGAIHIPGWLDSEQQETLESACRAWAGPTDAIPPTRLPRGGVMSVRTVCLGWHWYPYGYSRTVGGTAAERASGPAVPPLPAWVVGLGRRAVAAAYGEAGDFQPDVAIINFYGPEARLGMHRDTDERTDAPVVSLSVGAPARFRFGNPDGRGRPWHDLDLDSGDLFVFGGPSRFAYHGVLKVAGPRWNITLRETGLSARTTS